MAKAHLIASLGVVASLVMAPVAHAQAPASGPSQPGDLELGCPGLALEIGKAAQLLTQTSSTAMAAAEPASNAGLEAIGKAYQQQQNAQQLANLQALAARGGVDSGTASAAIGSLAALQQVAANGGNVEDAARSVVGEKVSSEIASRVPGGALVGGLVGGMFKKKKKAAPVAAPAAADVSGPQARLAFLSALVAAKGCK